MSDATAIKKERRSRFGPADRAAGTIFATLESLTVRKWNSQADVVLAAAVSIVD